MTDYDKIRLSDHIIVGSGLPSELVGLDQTSLNDLSAALNPCPSYLVGIGYWPRSYISPPFDAFSQKLTSSFSATVNVGAKTTEATWNVVSLTAQERAEKMAPMAEANATALIHRTAAQMRANGDRVGALEYLQSKGMLQ